MKSIRARIGAVVTAASLLSGGAVVATAPAASATECRVNGHLCGYGTNDGSSVGSVKFTCNYGSKEAAAVYVRPGYSAPCKDDDGWYTASGHPTMSMCSGSSTYTYDPVGWHKISDGTVCRVLRRG